MGKTSRKSFECLCNTDFCLVRKIAILRQIFVLKGNSVTVIGTHNREAVGYRKGSSVNPTFSCS